MQDNLLSGGMILYVVRIMLFFLLLLAASYQDIKTRTIPDGICLMIALISLCPLEPIRMLGIFAAFPFLVAAMISEGMGGGDIKLMGASGMVLGFYPAMLGMIVGLILLLFFHGMRKLLWKIKKKPWNQKKEQAYPLVPFLTGGMIVSTALLQL